MARNTRHAEHIRFSVSISKSTYTLLKEVRETGLLPFGQLSAIIDTFLRDEMLARLKLRDTSTLTKRVGSHGIPYASRIEWLETGVLPETLDKKDDTNETAEQ